MRKLYRVYFTAKLDDCYIIVYAKTARAAKVHAGFVYQDLGKPIRTELRQ